MTVEGFELAPVTLCLSWYTFIQYLDETFQLTINKSLSAETDIGINIWKKSNRKHIIWTQGIQLYTICVRQVKSLSGLSGRLALPYYPWIRYGVEVTSMIGSNKIETVATIVAKSSNRFKYLEFPILDKHKHSLSTFNFQCFPNVHLKSFIATFLY